MRYYYLDASALIKRYIDEIGSDWVRTLLDMPEASFFVAHFFVVEVTSAFTRRIREGLLTLTDYHELQNIFQADCVDSYNAITAVGEIIDTAKTLLEKHLLRALDAMHLATALIVNQWLLANNQPPLTFLCADERLLAAAAAEGLAVDNPNNHP
ncbi:MAG TPA: type II toxin-antitoxin system VapC family toxin [Anaerolineae bacterium]|nr:type II toxin-antitoxin system VapC family toxin [Anaerolineae bacterium]HQK13627.1 type II toxin-antitoxin system VapC family toxin [Anaerolineae bacterium]